MTNIIDLPKQSLSVTIWNHNKGKQHEYIGMYIQYFYIKHRSINLQKNFIKNKNFASGGLILGLNAKGERLRHWASLIKHPNKVHMKTHTLSANFLS